MMREISDYLPTRPPVGMMSWIEHEASRAGHQLGPDMTIFWRESVEINLPEWDELETSESVNEKLGQIRRTWGAHCSCTVCGEDWIAGWHAEGDVRGIVCLSPDAIGGDVYVDDPILTEGRVAKLEDEGAIFFPEGDRITCPNCCSETQLVHRSSLRHGRTWQSQVVSLHDAAGYGVLMYWLVWRRMNEDGIWEMGYRPREALVIGPRGGLSRYSRTRYGELAEGPSRRWERRETVNPEQMPFYSYDSGRGRKTLGAWVYPCPEDMTGCTGEKTGIEQWIREGRNDAAIYLGTWRRHRNVENLVKAGWGHVIEAAIEEEVTSELEYTGMYAGLNARYLLSIEIPWIFWDEAKPHRMLAMSRAEMRQALDRRLGLRDLEQWCRWACEKPGTLTAGEYLDALHAFGYRGLETLMSMEADGWGPFDIRQVLRYLKGQRDLDLEDAGQLFRDYRTMLIAQALDLGMPLEDMEMWPRHLRAAHDRLAGIRDGLADAYAADFHKLKELYAPLEWTDGELCIVVPGSPGDLKREGAVLHHCVGGAGYSAGHCKGKPIFFVRHYRRPERPYYTLNENLSGRTPARVQLHGYGNEYHTDKKGSWKRHRIPQQVKDFVDRWEREILAPWAAEHYRQTLEQLVREADQGGKKKAKRRNVA